MNFVYTYLYGIKQLDLESFIFGLPRTLIAEHCISAWIIICFRPQRVVEEAQDKPHLGIRVPLSTSYLNSMQKKEKLQNVISRLLFKINE